MVLLWHPAPLQEIWGFILISTCPSSSSPPRFLSIFSHILPKLVTSSPPSSESSLISRLTDSPSAPDFLFTQQPLWLVVFQTYRPLSIFISHNFVVVKLCFISEFLIFKVIFKLKGLNLVMSKVSSSSLLLSKWNQHTFSYHFNSIYHFQTAHVKQICVLCDSGSFIRKNWTTSPWNKRLRQIQTELWTETFYLEFMTERRFDQQDDGEGSAVKTRCKNTSCHFWLLTEIKEIIEIIEPPPISCECSSS